MRVGSALAGKPLLLCPWQKRSVTALDTLKVQLRREARQHRQAVSASARHAAAFAVIRVARQQGLLKRGRKIAAYVPQGSEFPVWPLVLAALQAGCAVYLPVVPRSGRQLSFVRFDERTRWHTGAYGIPEPRHPDIIPARALDLVFLPLLAFDSRLYRLGQGGGFYDCTFAFRRHRCHWRKPSLIGVSFDAQHFAEVPAAPWDLQLDAMLTETGLIRRLVPPMK